MAITKKFANVAIVDIKAPKTTTPGATAGMVVVYAQAHSTEYAGTHGQSAAKAALGIKPGETVRNYEGERKFSEFYSNAEIAACNDGAGLAIGDQVPGVAISSLSSDKPFFVGQQPYSRTGLYYSPLVETAEDGQPNDRRVDNSQLPHNITTALAQTTLERLGVSEHAPEQEAAVN